jgi:hypothetical protein
VEARPHPAPRRPGYVSCGAIHCGSAAGAPPARYGARHDGAIEGLPGLRMRLLEVIDLPVSERRYGYYATGEREPNLATLVRICEALAASPNDLLLPEGKPPANPVVTRITAATDALTLPELELAACLIECVSAHRPLSRSRTRSTGAISD